MGYLLLKSGIILKIGITLEFPLFLNQLKSKMDPLTIGAATLFSGVSLIRQQQIKRKRKEINYETAEAKEQIWKLLLGIDEKLKSLDQVRDKIHPRQMIFINALEESIKRYAISNKKNSYYSYILDIPLLCCDGKYHLIQYEHILLDTSSNFVFLKNYQGEPLKPRVTRSRYSAIWDLPLEIRKTMLHFLELTFEENGRNFPFQPRLMRVMKCYHENPEFTAQKVANWLTEKFKDLAPENGYSRSTVQRYNGKIRSDILDYLPGEDSIFQQDAPIGISAISKYLWEQGLDFEFAKEKEDLVQAEPDPLQV